MTLTLRSDAFAMNHPIPGRYTCDGENISPPLSWSGEPAETQAFALIVDDPDAPGGDFTHWVMCNIPGELHQLLDGTAALDTYQQGVVQGRNDFDSTGYAGPCPPAGGAHHYRFTLYALDTGIASDDRMTKQDLLRAIEGHVLDQATLIGTYERQELGRAAA